MSTTQDHYDKLLGPIYAWMVGDFEAAKASSTQMLVAAGALPNGNGLAIDLGCGHGVQSIPLAEGGYEVLAIDTCDHLLATLRQRGLAKIRAINDDLANFASHLSAPAQTVVCMGDTLTHLASEEDALSLIRKAADSLEEGGTLCLSFRDYTSTMPVSRDRFIPVKLDDGRLHTCFLEDAGDHVRVTDLVHSRADDGWQLTASDYLKAKISPESVKQTAEASHLKLMHEASQRGMMFYGFRR